MRKEHLKLTESEHSYLTTLPSSGQLKARQFKRAMTLLLLDEGKTMTEVSKLLKYCYPSVITVCNNYLEVGVQCLEEKPRAGRPVLIDGLAKTKITALDCSTPPLGRSVWSPRLLADKAVELALVEAVSHNEVGRIFKKNHLKPHLKKTLRYRQDECFIYSADGEDFVALGGSLLISGIGFSAMTKERVF